MLAIFVIVSSCLWSNGFCYTKSEPMPIEVCKDWAKEYNANKPLNTNYAYCEEKTK